MLTIKSVYGTTFAINTRDISTIRDDGDQVRVAFTNGDRIDVAMKFDDFMKLINEQK